MASTYLLSCLIKDSNSIFQTEFELQIENCLLSLGRSSPGIPNLPETSGCYLWVVDNKTTKYCVYVGKTTNLRRRIKDYSAHFQMKAPNDFKLRFFEELLRSTLPDSKLSLYFKPVPKEKGFEEERRLIGIFNPVINNLKPNSEDSALIQDAYKNYYWSALRKIT